MIRLLKTLQPTEWQTQHLPSCPEWGLGGHWGGMDCGSGGGVCPKGMPQSFSD